MVRFVISRRLVPVTAVMLACVAGATSAQAQGRPSQPSEQQLADQAYDLQQSGHYAEAIAIYLKAYEISKDGLTLLNVATIYDKKLHMPALAAEYYRRYLISPDAEPERVRKTTERLTALRAEAEEERQKSVAAPPEATPTGQAPPASTAPPPPVTPALPSLPVESPPSNRGSTLRTTGLIVGGVGVLGVAGSMVVGYLAKTKNDDANKVCQGSICPTQGSAQSAKDAVTLSTVSTVAFIGGLSLTATGIALYVLAPSGGSTAPTQAKAGRVVFSPSVTPWGGGLSVGGAF
jgi:hypothetical protein